MISVKISSLHGLCLEQLLGKIWNLKYYNAQIGKTYAIIKALNKLIAKLHG
ncbi:hypothetical protein [Candidatus Enterovibrio altilux]|uniref:hypothetical protein n=1 Tax=Candidatus Enterovibrio altilux TaxID=1927128 RepID=UPI0013747BBE|nr:hypothetical protein [Candidatus Enterovibrio luxaltus]